MSPQVSNTALKELLAGHDLLQDLPEAHIEQLTELAELRYIDEGDYLARAGETANCCYLIHTGRVALELYHPTRGAIRLESLGPNKILGWSWLSPPFMWHFDARTVEDTQVIALDGPELLRAIESDHELGFHLLKRFTRVFADRLHHARLQLIDNVSPR